MSGKISGLESWGVWLPGLCRGAQFQRLLHEVLRQSLRLTSRRCPRSLLLGCNLLLNGLLLGCCGSLLRFCGPCIGLICKKALDKRFQILLFGAIFLDHWASLHLQFTQRFVLCNLIMSLIHGRKCTRELANFVEARELACWLLRCRGWGAAVAGQFFGVTGCGAGRLLLLFVFLGLGGLTLLSELF